MSNKKQFGVWMDSSKAIVVENQGTDGPVTVSAHIKAETFFSNSNENTGHNHEKTEQTKFFNEIASHLTNATHIHVSGTGQIQEQFNHFLASTPQFKDSETSDSTSNHMSDEKLIEFMTEKF